MKLVRWPVAAVTAYVIYKYTIGKKTKGEAVFASPEPEEAPAEPEKPEAAAKPKPKPKRTRKPKGEQIG